MNTVIDSALALVVVVVLQFAIVAIVTPLLRRGGKEK